MWSCPPIWDRSAGFAARRSLWACANPDQPPRRPALGRKDGPPRYSAPDVSPADPCNKVPQSQAEHDAQRQRRRDRQGRIVGLTAPRGPWFGAPGRDRLFGEPHRQAATLAQRSIIFRPVRYPILLFRNVVTAIGIGLEWHGGHISGGLWMVVTPSHLGLLSQICRPL